MNRGGWRLPVLVFLLLAVMTAAFAEGTVERKGSGITYRDLGRTYLRGEGTSGVLVIYLRYTDGYVCDQASFEQMFTGTYDSDHRLGSVASYFRYNSCGKADFDFHFVYYDTGLTCEQAYRTVAEDGEDYFIRVFESVRRAYRGDFRELDRDGDGYADLVVFVGGEDPYKTARDGEARYVAGSGATGERRARANPARPDMRMYIQVVYDTMKAELRPAARSGGPRVLIHEMGHAFGLMDYYDTRDLNGELIDSLGTFDMQSDDVGDWNPFSRMACGWLDPYVIPEDADTVTLTIGCSSTVPDAILIPTSRGWNGTAFDEYILIDVMAPEGANGYDWARAMDERQIGPYHPMKDGGVRILHVDARLLKKELRKATASYAPAYTREKMDAILNDPAYGKEFELIGAFTNSNGYEPYLEGGSRWHHLVELVPSDGTSKYRKSTPVSWAIFTIFSPKDLFGPGEVFTVKNCWGAFPDAPYMNNGGTLDWSVTVDAYDPVAHEAAVTVRKTK